jgi:hypothetical protein
MALALSVAGGSFQLLDVKNDRYFTGEASTCNVERVIRVRLPPAQISDVLLGDAPVLPHKGAQVSWNGKKNRWALVLELEGGGTETIEFGEKGHNVQRAERVSADGKRLWWIEHEDFSTQKGGVVMPERSRFQQGDKADQEVIVKVLSQDVNVELPESTWVIEPPGGMVQEEMRCNEH